MNAQQIYDRLKEEFGDSIIELVAEAPSNPFINISTDNLVDICLFLRDEKDLLFDYLSNLSGMDYGDKLGVVYHLYSYKLKHRIVFKLTTDRDNPHVQTVEKVWS